jgi:hypothetical protein
MNEVRAKDGSGSWAVRVAPIINITTTQEEPP